MNKSIALPSNKGNMSERTSKSSVCAEFKDRNRKYVFIFGYTGSGKTTVLALIMMYIRIKHRTIIDPISNGGGIKYINHIINKINQRTFPDPNSQGTIIEYDIDVTDPNSGEEIPFTFIELAGEDFKMISTEEGDGGAGQLRPEIRKYLECPEISLSFLLVADYKNRVLSNYLEDDLFRNFFGYLHHLKVDYSRVGIIVSKFDRDATKGTKLADVIEKHLPATYQTVKYIEHGAFFPFTIGTVEKNKEGVAKKILTVDLSDVGKIFNWLYTAVADPIDSPEQHGYNDFI